jgi:hypothetical protein
MSQVLLRCYDFPSRLSGRLFASLPGSTPSSSVRVSQLALPIGRRDLSGRGHCSTGDPLPVHSHVDVNGISQVSRRSILCLAPLYDPGRTDDPSPLDGFVDAAPALPTAKASAVDEFRGSITRLWHLLPTLQERCCHHPCKTRFRLAGSPLPGGRRPSGSLQKVSDHPSSFSGLGLAQGKFHFEPPSLHIIRSPRRRARAASAARRGQAPWRFAD